MFWQRICVSSHQCHHTKPNEKGSQKKWREKWQRASAKVYQSQCAHFPVNNFHPSSGRRERLKCVPNLSVCNSKFFSVSCTFFAFSLIDRHPRVVSLFVSALFRVSESGKKHFLHQGICFEMSGMLRETRETTRTIDTLNRIFRTAKAFDMKGFQITFQKSTAKEQTDIKMKISTFSVVPHS